jgi:hypothetical protein
MRVPCPAANINDVTFMEETLRSRYPIRKQKRARAAMLAAMSPSESQRQVENYSDNQMI